MTTTTLDLMNDDEIVEYLLTRGWTTDTIARAQGGPLDGQVRYLLWSPWRKASK